MFSLPFLNGRDARLTTKTHWYRARSARYGTESAIPRCVQRFVFRRTAHRSSLQCKYVIAAHAATPPQMLETSFPCPQTYRPTKNKTVTRQIEINTRATNQPRE